MNMLRFYILWYKPMKQSDQDPNFFLKACVSKNMRLAALAGQILCSIFLALKGLKAVWLYVTFLYTWLITPWSKILYEIILYQPYSFPEDIRE